MRAPHELCCTPVAAVQHKVDAKMGSRARARMRFTGSQVHRFPGAHRAHWGSRFVGDTGVTVRPEPLRVAAIPTTGYCADGASPGPSRLSIV